jgi:hypothetical protein
MSEIALNKNIPPMTFTQIREGIGKEAEKNVPREYYLPKPLIPSDPRYRQITILGKKYLEKIGIQNAYLIIVRDRNELIEDVVGDGKNSFLQARSSIELFAFLNDGRVEKQASQGNSRDAIVNEIKDEAELKELLISVQQSRSIDEGLEGHC